MPDVIRSDSQRSDTSLRPRVSFNRDVHVKRIVPRAGQTALYTDENNFSIFPSVKKERTLRPKKEFVEETIPVTPVDQYSLKTRTSPEKFHTLPRRRKHNEEIRKSLTSLDRKLITKKDTDAIVSKCSKNPQKIFEPQYINLNKTPSDSSSLKTSTKKTKPKKIYLHRSVSDAGNSKSFENVNDKNRDDRKHDNSLRVHKKQLSPIVELTSGDDYFSGETVDNNEKKKENNVNVINSKSKLKKYIEKENRNLGNEKKRKSASKKNEKKIIVIDIDKAEDITKAKGSKSKNSLFRKKFKSVANKRNKSVDEADIAGETERKAANVEGGIRFSEFLFRFQPSLRMKKSHKSSQDQVSLQQSMIHRSQKPVDRPTLTKGSTVNVMVRRLNTDTSSSPPPKPNRMVIPNQFNQHNNNQPFSYTRGLSPEKYVSSENLTSSSKIPIIYAQVVCNNEQNGSAKQTVHTTYSKRYSNSDSDEGLGNEETSTLTRAKYDSHKKTLIHFGDDIQTRRESSFASKVINRKSSDIHALNSDSETLFIESCQRGCGDGMESKRTEGSLEPIKKDLETDESDSTRNNLSARRDLLESRITRRIHDKIATELKFEKSISSSSSPVVEERRNRKYSSDLELPSSKSYYSTDEPKSFDSSVSDYNRPFLENKDEIINKKAEMRQKAMISKNLCKSTPDIYRHRSTEPISKPHTFHESLQRDKYKRNRTKIERNRLGDSGTETDIKHDFAINLSSRKNRLYCSDNHIESEDEGFASSLLIASEKQHTEDNINRTLPRNDYDSDATFFGEDDPYHHLEHMDYKVHKSYNDEYIPRERNIDDGSHFDPIIDKELINKQNTLKRNEKQTPKPEKRSGLQKVKQLFTRDSKKKKEIREMVREESLLARYTEYKGKEDAFDHKEEIGPNELNKDTHHGTRKRMPTPTSNSTQIHEGQNTKKSLNSYPNWFKSLERISLNSRKKEEKHIDPKSNKKELQPSNKNSSSKSLRFFGDTDTDSDNLRKQFTPKSQITHKDRVTSQSWRDVHNTSERGRNIDIAKRSNGYKSMLDISGSDKEHENFQSNQKPPIFPNPRNVPKSRHNRRKKYEQYSVESSTEGDSSQQSQRSIVYLHAATVGDIPGRTVSKYSQRMASKEELAINDSSRIEPRTKTLSRSFSVLAPWKPRYDYENRYIDYSQNPNLTTKSGKKENVSTQNYQEKRDKTQKNGSFTLSANSRNKNNTNITPKNDTPQRSSSTLYRKKERISRENSKYYKDKEDRNNPTKSHSVESLRNVGRSHKKRGGNNRDIFRSLSMPKDTMKTAGWYKNKKDHQKSEYDMRRV